MSEIKVLKKAQNLGRKINDVLSDAAKGTEGIIEATEKAEQRVKDAKLQAKDTSNVELAKGIFDVVVEAEKEIAKTKAADLIRDAGAELGELQTEALKIPLGEYKPENDVALIKDFEAAQLERIEELPFAFRGKLKKQLEDMSGKALINIKKGRAKALGAYKKQQLEVGKDYIKNQMIKNSRLDIGKLATAVASSLGYSKADSEYKEVIATLREEAQMARLETFKANNNYKAIQGLDTSKESQALNAKKKEMLRDGIPANTRRVVKSIAKIEDAGDLARFFNDAANSGNLKLNKVGAVINSHLAQNLASGRRNFNDAQKQDIMAALKALKVDGVEEKDIRDIFSSIEETIATDGADLVELITGESWDKLPQHQKEALGITQRPEDVAAVADAIGALMNEPTARNLARFNEVVGNSAVRAGIPEAQATDNAIDAISRVAKTSEDKVEVSVLRSFYSSGLGDHLDIKATSVWDLIKKAPKEDFNIKYVGDSTTSEVDVLINHFGKDNWRDISKTVSIIAAAKVPQEKYPIVKERKEKIRQEMDELFGSMAENLVEVGEDSELGFGSAAYTLPRKVYESMTQTQKDYIENTFNITGSGLKGFTNLMSTESARLVNAGGDKDVYIQPVKGKTGFLELVIAHEDDPTPNVLRRKDGSPIRMSKQDLMNGKSFFDSRYPVKMTPPPDNISGAQSLLRKQGKPAKVALPRVNYGEAEAIKRRAIGEGVNFAEEIRDFSARTGADIGLGAAVGMLVLNESAGLNRAKMKENEIATGGNIAGPGQLRKGLRVEGKNKGYNPREVGGALQLAGDHLLGITKTIVSNPELKPYISKMTNAQLLTMAIRIYNAGPGKPNGPGFYSKETAEKTVKGLGSRTTTRESQGMVVSILGSLTPLPPELMYGEGRINKGNLNFLSETLSKSKTNASVLADLGVNMQLGTEFLSKKASAGFIKFLSGEHIEAVDLGKLRK